MPRLTTIAASEPAPAVRVLIDRRIAEERMTPLYPPFERPDWFDDIGCFAFVPNAFVMDATGTVSIRWCPADEIDWTSVVAVRLETSWGALIDPAGLGFEDDY